MTKVSICIPAYNQVKYLKRTIDSIVSQTYTDYEIIITDDSPTDVVFDLVQEYQSERKIQYYKNAIPLGSPENWNEAIRLSNGEFIKIMHHDDYFTFSDSLQVFVDLMENSPEAILGFSSSVVHLIDKNKIWIHSPTSVQLANLKVNPYCLFFGNFIGAPSATIFRKSSNIFFDKNLKWVVDFEFYSRILLKNNVFVYNQRELITTVGGDHNVTNECENNRNIEIKEYIYFFSRIPFKNIQFKKSIYFFRNRFTKFEVFSIQDIKSCGYDGRIPLLIYSVLFLNKLIKYLKKNIS
jgi:glycosyltransferase involved in cell wall biosynthesis